MTFGGSRRKALKKLLQTVGNGAQRLIARAFKQHVAGVVFYGEKHLRIYLR
jgi:hypothetical protein